MGEKTKAQRMASRQGIDELSIEAALRKRHKQDYPTAILNLTKRIQAVNQTWARVFFDIMNIPGASLNFECIDDKLIITVRIGEGVETHEVTYPQLQEAHQYIEVFIMDKIDHSELLTKWHKENQR
jgi:hypothetical protein